MRPMRRLWRYRFRRTTLQLVFCLSILAGLGLARFNQPIDFAWWLTLPVLILSWHRRFVALVLVVFAGLALGLSRGSAFMTKLDTYQPWYYRKTTITAVASEDALYGKTKQLSFAA